MLIQRIAIKIKENIFNFWNNQEISPYSFVLPWFIIAFSSIYFKYQILDRGGFRIIKRSFGIPESSSLTFLEKVSFFQNDILYTFVIVPTILLIVFHLLKKKLRIYFSTIIYFIIFTFLFVQSYSFKILGRFLSFPLFFDSLNFMKSEKNIVANYISASAIIKLCIVFIFLFLSLVMVQKLSIKLREKKKNNILYGLFIYITVFSFISFSPLSGRSKKSIYHKDFFLSAIFQDQDKEYFSSLVDKKLSEGTVENYFKNITRTSNYSKDNFFYSKEKNSDIIFFIFETGPEKCLAINENIEDLKNLNFLKEKAILSVRHYSTYPYTNRALFSIFTSCYPSSYLIDVVDSKKIPNIITHLNKYNYITSIYSSSPPDLEEDKILYENLMFQKKFFANTSNTKTNIDRSFKNRKERDIECLLNLKNDISNCIDRKRNFMVVYLPQIGHAPWPDFGEKSSTAIDRGRRVLKIQDEWLGEIIQILKEKEHLKKTIIMVTADHGIRNNKEDDSFPAGMIDEYSFHVPFLIYTPNTLESTLEIDWLTSHIDIAPTVMDLCDIKRSHIFEQGRPIWDSNIKYRRTFFLANHYLGADGYYENGKYFMWHHVSDVVYKNNKMKFVDTSIISNQLDIAMKIKKTLVNFSTINQLWLQKLTKNRPNIDYINNLLE